MDTLILNGGYLDSLSHFVPDLHILTNQQTNTSRAAIVAKKSQRFRNKFLLKLKC